MSKKELGPFADGTIQAFICQNEVFKSIYNPTVSEPYYDFYRVSVSEIGD